MGRAAEQGSDAIWVTSDNPRTEDPHRIIDDIVSGLQSPAQVSVDRRTAIAAAIEAAGPTDVVLIAGKGHETTQTIGGVAHPFDDALVAAESLARHFGGAA